MALADRLHSLSIHLLRTVRKTDEATRLSPARLSALSVVVFVGPVTMTQLARAEGVTPPTMTRLVQALEADGLVARAGDRSDGRVVLLRATPAGRRLMAAARAQRVATLAELLTHLDVATLTTVSRAVDALEPVMRP